LYNIRIIIFSQPTNHGLFGIWNENIYPIPSAALFCAVILPPWTSTIFLDTYSPRLVLWESVEKNIENNLVYLSL
jgi:hypothetical protein